MSWAVVAVTAIVVGGSIQAYGAYQQGQAAEEEAKAQQNILNYNALLKEKEAKAEEERAREEARQFKLEGLGLLGTAAVGYAKGGVLTTMGTPELQIKDMRANLDADRLRILKEGYLASSFRESEAAGLRYEGLTARVKGANLKTAYRYQAAGSILTSIGSAAYVGSTLKSPGTTFPKGYGQTPGLGMNRAVL